MLKRPTKSPTPVPLLSVVKSPGYHDTQTGACGSWMTKRSNPVFVGSPRISTCIVSTGPSELIVTRPEALGIHPAVTAPLDRTMLKTVFFWAAAGRAKVNTPLITTANRYLFMGIFLLVVPCCP